MSDAFALCFIAAAVLFAAAGCCQLAKTRWFRGEDE